MDVENININVEMDNETEKNRGKAGKAARNFLLLANLQLKLIIIRSFQSLSEIRDAAYLPSADAQDQLKRKSGM